jgi:non-ribosomal peptide synthetase component E (peptide arylation enzyme)
MAGYAAGSRYRDATLASMLDDAARRHPTREALVFLERRLAYADLLREVERCARGFLALGVEPDDKVALPDVPRTSPPHGDKVQRVRLREDALRLLGRER